MPNVLKATENYLELKSITKVMNTFYN